MKMQWQRFEFQKRKLLFFPLEGWCKVVSKISVRCLSEFNCSSFHIFKLFYVFSCCLPIVCRLWQKQLHLTMENRMMIKAMMISQPLSCLVEGLVMMLTLPTRWMWHPVNPVMARKRGSRKRIRTMKTAMATPRMVSTSKSLRCLFCLQPHLRQRMRMRTDEKSRKHLRLSMSHHPNVVPCWSLM